MHVEQQTRVENLSSPRHMQHGIFFKFYQEKEYRRVAGIPALYQAKSRVQIFARRMKTGFGRPS